MFVNLLCENWQYTYIRICVKQLTVVKLKNQSKIINISVNKVGETPFFYSFKEKITEKLKKKIAELIGRVKTF